MIGMMCLSRRAIQEDSYLECIRTYYSLWHHSTSTHDCGEMKLMQPVTTELSIGTKVCTCSVCTCLLQKGIESAV